jgi:ectoine hydroxylase-related dioxygenase (phytanoyl-CoA dioxygenase family)
VAEARKIVDELEPLYRPDLADGPRSHYRVQDGWQESPAARGLACHPRILELLEALYGRRPFPFQTLNFSTGTQQRNHSDSIHFSSMPRGFMCGVWVALEDTDAGNGPLFYAPGSHRLPELTLTDFGMTLENASYVKYEDGITDAVTAAGLAFEEVHVPLGTAFIWSSNLVHGGMPIRETGRTRHSQVTHYFFDDCVYYTPFYSEVPTGELFVRVPTDISTGKPVAPSINGHAVRFEPARNGLMRLQYADVADATPADLRERFAGYAAGLGEGTEAALDALVSLYQSRDDLRDAFGGYDDLDVTKLVGWSIQYGVAGDDSAALLRPHEAGLRRLADALEVAAKPSLRQRLRRR